MCLNKVCTVEQYLVLFQILSEFLDPYLKDLRISKQDIWLNNLMSKFLPIDIKRFMIWLKPKDKLLSRRFTQSEILRELVKMSFKLFFSMDGKLNLQWLVLKAYQPMIKQVTSYCHIPKPDFQSESHQLKILKKQRISSSKLWLKILLIMQLLLWQMSELELVSVPQNTALPLKQLWMKQEPFTLELLHLLWVKVDLFHSLHSLRTYGQMPNSSLLEF